MKVLATGSTGTLGRYLRNSAPFKGDIRSSDLAQLKGFQSFLHLAGVVGTKNVAVRIHESREINIDATIALARRAIDLGYSQFIFVSSSHVYAQSEDPIDEFHALNPQTDYAKQKVEAELELQEIFKNSDSNLIIVRLFSVLGQGMPDFTLGGLADRISNGSGEVINFADDLRDFITPEQAAAALDSIASHGWIQDLVFNLCTGNALSVQDAITRYLQSRGSSVSDELFIPGQSGNSKIVGDNRRLITYLPSLGSILEDFTPSKNAY